MSPLWSLLSPVAAFGCSWLVLRLVGRAFAAAAYRQYRRQQAAPINFPRQQDRRSA